MSRRYLVPCVFLCSNSGGYHWGRAGVGMPPLIAAGLGGVIANKRINPLQVVAVVGVLVSAFIVHAVMGSPLCRLQI